MQSAGAGAVGYYQNTFESNVTGGNYESANGLLDKASYGSITFVSSAIYNFQTLYLPDTGGGGSWRPYFNGNTLTANGGGTATLSWSKTGPASPVMGGQPNPNGAFSYPQVNSQLCGLIINAGVQEPNGMTGGPGWPVYVQSVVIWGQDSSVLVTQT